MKIFVCILIVAVARCHAGIEAGFDTSDHGLGDNSGGQYSAPLTGGDFSGQGHDFSGAQGGHFAGSQGGNEFSPSHSQEFSGGQGGHGFSGAQSEHDFSGGQNSGFAGGHGNDFTLALSQGQDFSGHGQQQFNFGNAGLGHGFGADSYLQAAHDLGSQNFQGDTGHNIQGDVSGAGDSSHEEQSENNHGLGGHDAFGHGDQQGFLLQDGGHEFGDQQGFGDVHAFPVGEHVDEEHPVEVPLYKHVVVPIHRPVHVNVPKPILVGVPQPYPVKVPVHKPVAVPVETEISIPIEKVVPYPVVKHVPYPVEKHVPIKIEKTVTVHVPQPYPVKIPVYKTIHHKGHH